MNHIIDLLLHKRYYNSNIGVYQYIMFNTNDLYLVVSKCKSFIEIVIYNENTLECIWSLKTPEPV